jgi:hypothetical protein
MSTAQARDELPVLLLTEHGYRSRILLRPDKGLTIDVVGTVREAHSHLDLTPAALRNFALAWRADIRSRHPEEERWRWDAILEWYAEQTGETL